MFTGIIRWQGILGSVEPRRGGVQVWIDGLPKAEAAEIVVGDSVAVDGVCLTVEERDGSAVRFYLSAETLDRTTAADWAPGRSVHLERAMRVGDGFDGHLVQGHIDAVTEVTKRAPRGEDLGLAFAVPHALHDAIFPKGSIAVDGVSLTINRLDGRAFEVNLIPHTLSWTHLGDLDVGDSVNIEADPIAKQVAWVMAQRAQSQQVESVDI